ncbi:MAG: hypothetical protein D6701_11605 [Gemmatimonadetes bacterium]|nr:MAG: hypothetical protein D6701_11605 [Gemmatimonadota bacterium]
MKRLFAALPAVFLTAACGGGAALGGGGFAYAVPSSGPLVYERADTSSIAVEVEGMGSLEMMATQLATLELDMAPSASGVQVTATVRDYKGSMNNPMAGTMTAGTSDIEGPLVFTVDAKGHGALLERPEVKGAAQTFFSPETVALTLLPLLPPDGTAAGDSWSDSIRFSAEADGAESLYEWKGTLTLAGDTVVDGRTLTKVTFTADVSLVTTGNMQGMDMTQTAAGGESGYYLWDPERRVVVYYETMSDMGGEIEVSMAPAPMPLSVVNVVRTRLVN